jgi:3-deoxy-manno-octulosonate cytidylyltransferase (CMP-KDO synthetase)
MFHVVIPARFAATRLPGKPLLEVAGRPLIEWVWRCARDSGALSVLIATDDERIREAASSFGAEVAMTAAEHASGTDRIAEVAQSRGFGPEEVIVNLQGDEPLMPPPLIGSLAAAVRSQSMVDIATAATPVRSVREFLDPNCVKAVCAPDGRALYFSRAPVPFPRDQAAQGTPSEFAHALRHIGIYAYRVRSLLAFSALPATPLELKEKLEQLRALEHGMRIQVLTLKEAPPSGVDTQEDLERVREVLSRSAS